jgi:hypothetical protein
MSHLISKLRDPERWWYTNKLNKHCTKSVSFVPYEAAAEIERMHLALSEILDSDDLSYIKARALVALPDK